MWLQYYTITDNMLAFWARLIKAYYYTILKLFETKDRTWWLQKKSRPSSFNPFQLYQILRFYIFQPLDIKQTSRYKTKHKDRFMGNNVTSNFNLYYERVYTHRTTHSHMCFIYPKRFWFLWPRMLKHVSFLCKYWPFGQYPSKRKNVYL